MSTLPPTDGARTSITAALACAAAFTLLALQSEAQAAGPAADAEVTAAAPTLAKRLTAQQARGKHLVDRSGCIDCHTPLRLGPKGPEPDLSRHLSGHPESLVMPPVPPLPDGPWQIVVAATATAHAGPWGVSFTANLTPDPETGLGNWTARDFKQTFRTGKRMGRGREILPPMPIPVYNNYNDADLEAIFAYLKTLPPIRNRVPEARPPMAAPAQAAAAGATATR